MRSFRPWCKNHCSRFSRFWFFFLQGGRADGPPCCPSHHPREAAEPCGNPTTVLPAPFQWTQSPKSPGWLSPPSTGVENLGEEESTKDL